MLTTCQHKVGKLTAEHGHGFEDCSGGPLDQVMAGTGQVGSFTFVATTPGN